ncbi:MAG: hypothetical protein HY319_00155 [Armatimonadetes bacterium]|nr:hypothetical protein [Armatimonadota bacterium]
MEAEIRGNQLTGNFPNFGFEADAFDSTTHCLAITGNTTDRFVFSQFGPSVLRVEDFANLAATNIAGTAAVEDGAVTSTAVGACGF